MTKRPTGKRQRRYIIIGSILLLLVILRLLLPAIVLHYANRELAKIEGYYGHVNDIDISLYRGAYQLDSIYINKKDKGGKQTKFFSARTVDLSVEWNALFDGEIVGEIAFISPNLIFTNNKTEIGQVARDTADFRELLKDFMPLKVNRFEVFNGSIHYVDGTTSPKVDIALNNAHILATNLKNTEDKKEKLPSTITATANAYEGNLSLKMKINGLAKTPTFDMSAEVKHANLVLLNDFFKAYGKFDVSRGMLGLYTEFAAADGKFAGYVKPIIKDLKVLGPEDAEDGFWQKAKEAILGLAGNILTNPRKDQVATKVPIEGTFKNSSIDNTEAIWELLKNAFISALLPAVDNEISLQTVQALPTEPEKKPGLLKRLFGGKKKDEQQ
ncbi:MAG: hypothetical protein K0Q79_2089 [Flavipsychrobacter sp.]|jgi:hypothetical protein|nr:hypothetical protein [Flavipsychrobacter sp.]